MSAQGQPQVQAAPPPARRTQDPAVAVAKLMGEADDWYVQLRRSLAGFTTLQQSLVSAQGGVPEGERKKGLPVFEMTAAPVGGTSREPIKLGLDLRKVNPEHVGHVLIPLMNAQANDLLEAVGELEERLRLVRPILEVMTGVAPPPAA